MTNALYLSYNGLLEPILSSQVIPYLRELAKKGFHFTLLTYEKKRDLERAGKDRIKSLREELRRLGIEWHYLRYHKRPAIFSTLFDLFIGSLYCAYIIPKKRISIVHARGVTPGSMMLILSKVFRVKLLFDMRGRLAEEMAAGGLWKEDSAPFKLVKKCEGSLLKRADAVTVLTDKHLKLIREADYLTNRKIPVDTIPCCVDMNKFVFDNADSRNFRETLKLEGKFVVIYPGKLGTFYLIDEMLRFFKVMLDIIPSAVLMILTTDEPSRLIKSAKAIGIREDQIRIEKDVAFELMPKYLRIADAGLFFINAYNKLGSSPIKLGEFLASGVPVIINPGVGDSDDIVNEYRAGIIVKEFNDTAYRNAVHDLLRLKKEGEALKERCRAAAGKRLSLEDGISRYYNIYKVLS